MINYKKSRIILLPIKHLYNIIIDVENYPKFVPWCKKCTVIKKTLSSHNNNFEDCEEQIIASMEVGFDNITSEYKSFVTCSHLEYVKVVGDSDMFDHLETLWELKEVTHNTTAIDFSIKFSFKNKLTQILASSAFKLVSQKIMESFETYAHATYNAKAHDKAL